MCPEHKEVFQVTQLVLTSSDGMMQGSLLFLLNFLQHLLSHRAAQRVASPPSCTELASISLVFRFQCSDLLLDPFICVVVLLGKL